QSTAAVRGFERGQFLGEGVDFLRASQRKLRRKRKFLELGAGELISVFPKLVRDPPANTTVTLGLTHLFEPETRRRGVQNPQQLQVLVFRRPFRQLYHRRRTVEDLPTSVKHKV